MNENYSSREEITALVRDHYKKTSEVLKSLLKSRYSRAFSWLKSLWEKEADPELAKREQEVKDAVKFFQDFKHESFYDYGPAIAYLKEQYDNLKKLDELYDEKAESIIKLLGGSTAIISLGVVFSIKPDSRSSMIMGFVALLFLIPTSFYYMRAVYHAIMVKKPRASMTFPDVKYALKSVEYFDKSVVDVHIWLILHPMCVQYAQRCNEKSVEVYKAYRYYKFAVVYLVFPLFAILVTLGCQLWL